MNNFLPDQVIQHAIERETALFKENPDSCVRAFTERLRTLGFRFSVSAQVKQFMPKHKDIILPLAVKYYHQAVLKNEKNYFISLMRYPCCKTVVPMLLDAFYKNAETDDRECISECIYSIHDKSYAGEYLRIVSTEEFGIHRAMFILLLGRMKYEKAIDSILPLLQDPVLCKYAIIALGDYRKKEFEPYFLQFADSDDPYLSRYAKRALEKLNNRCKAKEATPQIVGGVLPDAPSRNL